MKKMTLMAKKRKYPRGICRVCGCTDEWGCPEGCAGADKEHTICTNCVMDSCDTWEAFEQEVGKEHTIYTNCIEED